MSSRDASGYTHDHSLPSDAVEPEAELVERLRRGDEAAFAEMVERFHGRLVALARHYVSSEHAAEDVAQETWLALVRGVDRFEGRSSLKAWLFQVCVNRARTTGVRDKRTLAIGAGEPAVDPARFDRSGAWSDPPRPWTDAVDDRLEAEALVQSIRKAIDALPSAQQLVVTMRDVEGLTAEEVCTILSITDANQRVLLHRARAAIRRSLEEVRAR
jgi:RNA polymerase sigma-70 factor (ECF subfamily)